MHGYPTSQTPKEAFSYSSLEELQPKDEKPYEPKDRYSQQHCDSDRNSLDRSINANALYIIKWVLTTRFEIRPVGLIDGTGGLPSQWACVFNLDHPGEFLQLYTDLCV